MGPALPFVVAHRFGNGSFGGAGDGAAEKTVEFDNLAMMAKLHAGQALQRKDQFGWDFAH